MNEQTAANELLFLIFHLLLTLFDSSLCEFIVDQGAEKEVPSSASLLTLNT